MVMFVARCALRLITERKGVRASFQWMVFDQSLICHVRR